MSRRKAGLLSTFFLAAAGVAGCSQGMPDSNISYTGLLDEAERGNVQSITIEGEKITLDRETIPADSMIRKRAPGDELFTYLPANENPVPALRAAKVNINTHSAERVANPLLSNPLVFFGMFLGLSYLFNYIRQKQMMKGAGGLNIGKSRAQLLTDVNKKVTFKDVAGIEETKAQVEEVVDFLKDPQKFAALGARIPKGVLIFGDPGTGKTLLARAVAGEAGVPFFKISGSDFVEMFVGVGAARVRDMFLQAKAHAPCILFIDEIDAVGGRRGHGMGGGHDEREQTLNQLLVEMDGFTPNEGVIVIAATNRPDTLDPALLRRFERKVVVPLPDLKGRLEILKVHTKKTPLGADVSLLDIARGTPGFSGAALENLVNEAALAAARANRSALSWQDFEHAKDTETMGGVENRSRVISPEEMDVTAHHEAGHALLAHLLPASDPIHKATIIPRGRALGMVVRMPEGDPVSKSREQLWADLIVAAGGRVAEEMIFGADKVTTGASNDLLQRTRLATYMVKHWGLAEDKDLQTLVYGADEEDRRAVQSGRMTEKVEAAIHHIAQATYQKAEEMLKAHEGDLRKLALTLRDYETLTGTEIGAVLRGEELKKDIPRKPAAPAAPKVA